MAKRTLTATYNIKVNGQQIQAVPYKMPEEIAFALRECQVPESFLRDKYVVVSFPVESRDEDTEYTLELVTIEAIHAMVSSQGRVVCFAKVLH